MPLQWQDQEIQQLKALALQRTAPGAQPKWPAIADAYTAHPGPAREGLGVARSRDAIMQKGKKHWKVGSRCAATKCCADATHSAIMQEWEAEVSAQVGNIGTAYTPEAEEPGM